MRRGFVININPGNAALEYIDKRLLEDNYRGNVPSQHNRYTMERVAKILTIFDRFAPNMNLMPIRTTDLSKRGENTADEATYAQFCNECKQTVGIGTQDAMRKNLFVDFHRMGLIVRYDVNRNAIDPYDRHKRKKFAALSEHGIRLIRAGNILDRYFIFSRAVDRLLGGYIGILLSLLGDPEYRLRKIDIYEFMFFVSAIGTASRFDINIARCAVLIKSFRGLSPVQRHSVIDLLREKASPEKFSDYKPSKRDFHNWKNEAQQVYYILNQTAYFEVRNGNIYLKSGRSLSEKIQYFSHHGVQKTSGFELHHVVPLSWSESEYQFKLLDNWQNMVYIDGYSHARITQNRNRNVVMTACQDDLILSDYDENQVYLRLKENVLYCIDEQQTMLDYNDELLSSLS